MRNAVFIVNRPDYLLSHRLGLAISLRDAGYIVHVFSVPHLSSKDLEEHGFVFHPINIKRGGTNPFSELISIVKCYSVLKKISPDILHCITLKPVFYGSLIARFLSIPQVIVSIAGLGTVFTTDSLKNNILRVFIVFILKMGLNRKNVKSIFQNAEDKGFFVKNKIVREDQAHLIPGSGVDLVKFDLVPMPCSDKKVVLLPARLIAEKGVFEYIAAAKIILSMRDDIEFWLAGDLDPGNPTSLSSEQLDDLKEIAGIKFLGHRSDMERILALSTIVVLPSYREGFPKALIEASAVGRPIVTTNVPGCRDAVVDNVTGFIVPPKSVNDLVSKILLLISDDGLSAQFGTAARQLAVEKFDVNVVTHIHRGIYGITD